MGLGIIESKRGKSRGGQGEPHAGDKGIKLLLTYYRRTDAAPRRGVNGSRCGVSVVRCACCAVHPTGLQAGDTVGAPHQGQSVASSGDGDTAIVGGPADTPGSVCGAMLARLKAQGQSVALSRDGNSGAHGLPAPHQLLDCLANNAPRRGLYQARQARAFISAASSWVIFMCGRNITVHRLSTNILLRFCIVCAMAAWLR